MQGKHRQVGHQDAGEASHERSIPTGTDEAIAQDGVTGADWDSEHQEDEGEIEVEIELDENLVREIEGR